MKRLCTATVLAFAFLFSGCYHATVVTGEQPGTQTIEQPWATSFINGLVPPATVDATQQCNNGVARVETRLSFLNQIVTGLTFGIYSPMSITVTCASGSMSAMTPEADITLTDATRAELERSLNEAAARTAATGEVTAVLIRP
jgi:hypothetical protein